jgi:tetratricopeptide (TPR) repeat protein
MYNAEHEQVITLGERAIELAERFQDEEIRIDALNTVGCSRCETRDEKRGFSYLFKSLQLSLELNDPESINRAYFNLVEILTKHSRNREAREITQDYILFAEKIGNWWIESLSVLKLVTIDWLGGEWKTALGCLPQIERLDFGIWQIWANYSLGAIDNDLGRNEEAWDRLDRTLEAAIKTGEIQSVAPYLGELIRSSTALGPDSKNDEYVEMLIRHIGSTPFYDSNSVMPLLSACYWTLIHRKNVALKNGEACVSRIKEACQQLDLPVTKGALSEARGCLAFAKERPDQASEHFREAVKIWELVERPYDQARALNGLGRALIPADDLKGASKAYEQAMGIVESLADQLEDQELRESFLSSQLVEQILTSQSQLENVD